MDGWISSIAGKILPYLCLLIILVQFATMLNGSWQWPIMHDTAIFHYIGWYILQGGVPYKGILDINLPGVYLFHMLALMLFGESDLGFRIFDLSILFIICSGIAVFCWPFSRLYALIGASFFAMYHLWMGPWNMGQRDYLMCSLLVWGLYCFARFYEKPERIFSALLAGMLLTATTWVKPTAVLPLLGCLLLGAVAPVSRSKKLTGLLCFSTGGMLVMLAFAGWLLQMGVWPDFWDMLTQLLPLYRMTPFSDKGYLHDHNSYIFATCIALLLLVLLFECMSWRIRYYRTLMIGAGLVFGFANLYVQGKGLPYHFYPLWLFVALWMGSCLPNLRMDSSLLKWSIHVAMVGLLFYFNPESVRPVGRFQDEIKESRIKVEEAMSSVPESIRLSSPPTVQFMSYIQGNIWSLAYRMHLKPVNRHTHPFVFVREWDTPYMRKLRREFYQDITRTLPWTILIGPYALEEQDVFDSLGLPQPWREWFAQHYRRYHTGSEYQLYVRTQ